MLSQGRYFDACMAIENASDEFDIGRIDAVGSRTQKRKRWRSSQLSETLAPQTSFTVSIRELEGFEGRTEAVSPEARRFAVTFEVESPANIVIRPDFASLVAPAVRHQAHDSDGSDYELLALVGVHRTAPYSTRESGSGLLSGLLTASLSLPSLFIIPPFTKASQVAHHAGDSLTEEDVAIAARVRSELQQTIEPGRTVWTVAFASDLGDGRSDRNYAYGWVHFSARVADGDRTCGLRDTAVDSLSLFHIDYEPESSTPLLVEVLDELVVTADLFARE